MALVCAMSGQVPEEPVISVKSGHLFEKRLIEKHIEATGKCPMTNQDLAKTDLVPVQTNKAVKPRPVSATSIPGLLSLFQNEWDSVMLETFTLKQHLDTVRQELSHALYQHDAACRVIARLIKERDAARSALANVAPGQVASAQQAPVEAGEAMEVEQRLPKAVVDKLQSTANELSDRRKQREAPAGLATPAELATYKAASSHPLHKSTQPGILCLDIHRQHENIIATGGNDHTAVVFNRSTGKTISNLKGHSKKVSRVQFHPSEEVLFTASADGTARVYRKTGAHYKQAAEISAHGDSEVTGLSVHPCGDYLATTSVDGTWKLHDSASGDLITSVDAGTKGQGFTVGQFHPDGLIFGTGTTDSLIRLWDVRTGADMATFYGHAGQIRSIAFSENGYHLAAAAEDATVKLWDLRKLSNWANITVDDKFNINSISYDYSGKYLVVAGDDLRVYMAKKPNELVATYTEHSGPVTDAKFSHNASFLASTSMDRFLKVFSKP
eukprot:GILK01002076.1.p1 GENE.GILK01002076.1~~GILK01002076.1.p1  ORF type:complete len:514 (+),score=88.05 GILK01002076.1:50-1543(+)